MKNNNYFLVLRKSIFLFLCIFLLASLHVSYSRTLFFVRQKEKPEIDEKIKTISRILTRGEEYFQKKQYLKAKIEFEKVLKLEPNHAFAKEYIQKCNEALMQQDINKKIAKKQQKEEIAKKKAEKQEKYIHKKAKLEEKKKQQEQEIEQKRMQKEARKRQLQEARQAKLKAEEEKKQLALKEKEEKRLKTEQKRAELERLREAKRKEIQLKKEQQKKAKDLLASKKQEEKEKKKAEQLAKREIERKKREEIIAQKRAEKEKQRLERLAQQEAERRKKIELEAQKQAKKEEKIEKIAKRELKEKTQKEVATEQPVEVQKVSQEKEEKRAGAVFSAEEKKAEIERKKREEALKKADEEEKRIRAELEKKEASKRKEEAEKHFKLGLKYLEEKDFIKAHDEWVAVLELIPEHEDAKRMLEETKAEYETALAEQKKKEELARLEQEHEQRLNAPIITVEVSNQEIGDVLIQLGAIAGFNVVIGEGVRAKVSASFSNASFKEVLDTFLPPHGFKYTRTGPTIQVFLDLRTKVYQLTAEQTKRLRSLMIDEKILQRLLYGPEAKPKVPAQELYLDEKLQILTITDSQENINKLEEFLANLPAPKVPELITKTFILRRENAEEIRKLVQGLVSSLPAPGIPDEERKVILEKESNTLVVRDTLENIKKVEEYLADKKFLEKLTETKLTVQVYHLSPEEADMSEEALARKRELVDSVAEVLETMLYAVEGREKAYEMGRRIFKDYKFGTITVIDTEENQKTVASYISQLPTGKPKLLSKIFKINHVDPSRLQATIRQLLQESRGIGLGGLGGMGAWIEQTITPGSEGALTWQDLYVELTQLSGDTANPVARIYILVTSTGRDRERDFRRGESERVDNYRVRVKDIRLEAQEVDIEIRVVGLPGVTPGALAPGVAMPGVPSVTVPAAPAPAIPPTPQVGRVTMRVDSQTNSLIVMAEDPADLDMISEWIEKLDQPILQVSIEARFVEVNETKAKKLGIDWLIPSIHDTGSWRAVTDELRFAQPQDHPAVDLDPLYQTLRSHNLLRGMTVLQYVSEGGVSATLQALEAQGVVNVIQAPRVLALNQQPATITFSQAVPWMTWSLSAQALTVSWSEDSIGISLQVTPTIHSKESIILDIEPRVDKLVNRIPAGYDLVSNLAAPGISRNIWDYEIAGRPVIDRRSLTTRARIRSGETLVLGGLIEEREHIAESKVPFLGNIPILKYFFKRNIDYKDKTRLLIFLTATVVD